MIKFTLRFVGNTVHNENKAIMKNNLTPNYVLRFNKMLKIRIRVPNLKIRR